MRSYVEHHWRYLRGNHPKTSHGGDVLTMRNSSLHEMVITVDRICFFYQNGHTSDIFIQKDNLWGSL